jgi:hypothetical protein
MSKSVLTLTPVETVACCSPLSREPLSQHQAESIAPLLKALAEPVRLRLMSPNRLRMRVERRAFAISQVRSTCHNRRSVITSRCSMKPACSNERSEEFGSTTAPDLSRSAG